ncbi:MAG: argininosuccinate lyase [Thermomicrobiales bacterium]
MHANAAFPHPSYARFVLEPGFADAQRLLFPHMVAANQAHALMLAATGIIPPAQAAALLTANREVAAGGAGAFEYAPAVEDLFFAVESRLIELAGPDAGGNLQIARSRNDLDAVMCRLFLRDRLLAIRRSAVALRTVLLDLAESHVDTLMPGITHTQPAQPTTLAHYLLGVLGPLERDAERFAQCYERVNRSPLGVAAFTTTSFPIDRDLTARLLGFAGIVENGYDAVGASDHMLEATQALVTMTSSLSRFVHDLLIWSRAEAGILRIDDAFVQISSIMPQKRNPVVLEHIRARTGYVHGDAATVAAIAHSSAFGDTVDVEDPIYVPLDRAFDSAEAVVGLLTVALESATFDVDLLAARAGTGHTTTTALADALVLDHGLPFRTAHGIVSRLVKVSITGTPIDADAVSTVAGEVLGRPLPIGETWLAATLDPRRFIEARAIPGGPAPAATRAAIAAARNRLGDDDTAIAAATGDIEAAAKDRAGRIDALIMGHARAKA